MFSLIKQAIIALWSFSGSLPTKCVSLDNEPRIARPMLINLNPDNQRLCHYLVMFSLHRCNGSCNTFDDQSSRICVSNKTKDVNSNVFNMITWVDESKILMKNMLCRFRCKFDDRKCNVNHKWNSDECQCECT